MRPLAGLLSSSRRSLMTGQRGDLRLGGLLETTGRISSHNTPTASAKINVTLLLT